MIARRAFLKRVMMLAAAFFSSDLFRPAVRIFAAPALSESDKKIAVIKGKDLSRDTIFRMVKDGFEAMGGVSKFVRSGMKVVLKPNIGFNSRPERVHTTNPLVLEAVAKICVEAGARVSVFDYPVNNARLSYKNSGIEAAAKKAGAVLKYPDSVGLVSVPVKGGLNLKKVEVFENIMNADLVINMPVGKDHSSATLSLAMKNLMGVIGGSRGMYHISLHKNIVDFNKAVPVGLVILDATRILTAYGPNGGGPEDIVEPGTLIFGTNAVTVDSYAVTLFGKTSRDVDYLAMAGREGMGETSVGRMKLVSRSV